MLHLHRSERADALVDALGDVLRVPLADALAPEVVAVPTRGVERWLTQRLAHQLGVSGAGRGDGVCGNLDFPFPGRLVGEAVGAASGVARDADVWLPERSVWPLLEVIDAHLDEPWLATLAGYLGTRAEGQRSRRFSTARHLADLFDRYGVHRPAMIRAWAAGDDRSAAGGPLPSGSAWQAELWRRLRDRVGAASPAERLAEACAAIVDDPGLVDLPDRFSIFGLTRLPASYLEVLRALAVGRDVHLFLLHPSPVLWDEVAGELGPDTTIVRREDDPTAGIPRNPLLRSWGRDAREMQLVLSAGADASVETADEHRPAAAPDVTTLLGRLQRSVRDDEPLAPLVPSEGDRTVQVHACHGRARQVEVVRDAILHLLADDPSLEPRDVIVMCPDIETFAPLIHATFGAAADEAEEDDGDGTAAGPDLGAVDLRVRLADRSLRQTNPVLSAVSALLELADARVTATQVLDFAAREPVRRRFRHDDDDLERVGEWVSSTAIRWGINADHRAPFKLQTVGQNTWRAGLDRVLVGVTMAEEDDRLVEDVLPLDDVDSGAIDLAGRFAELVDRLATAVDALSGRKPMRAWAQALSESADALLATRERDAWQRGQLQALLVDASGEAGDRAGGVELELADVRSLLADRLRGQPTRANFRTGHLTFCTLVPMRSVPHRVVCLLGLDDDAFPRRTERDGDDLVAADPYVGDGDGRSEDRQLLLDALLAATEHLVITYSGHDERTNAPLAPAVPVGELLDAVGPEAAGKIVVHHPLQPFDPRNFGGARLGRRGPWSFDRVTLQGARALAGDRAAGRRRFLDERLPAPEPTGVIELDNLVRFVQHPVRAFLRQRLGISLGDWSDEVLDAMPVELDGLQAWAVGERVLAARLAGVSPEACAAAERARGELPPDGLARVAYDKIAKNVECLVRETEAMCELGAEVDSVEVAVPLDDGRLLVGTVPGLVGSVVRRVTYSRLAPKHRAPSWVRFLALTLARPSDELQVVTIGRSDKPGRTAAVSCFASMGEHDAGRHLHELIALYDRGMCEPLPVACATSAAYAVALREGQDAPARARKEWEGGTFKGEDADVEHQLVHGGRLDFDELLVDEPCDDERWDAAEQSRFGQYALRFWGGLLDAEKLEHHK
jgi:exodeoxyribonuclease V gamma subunit